MFLLIKALADEERKKLEDKEAQEEKKREEAERKFILSFLGTNKILKDSILVH